jgi:diguanylate cyclase (GGDEF)-like protein
LSEVFDLLLLEVQKLIPFDGANFMLVNEKAAHITRSRGYDTLGKDFEDQVNSLFFDIESFENIHYLVNEKKPLLIEDTHKMPDWKMIESSIHYHSWIGVPIIINGRVEAILALDKVEIGFYHENHATIMTAFADQAASAIRNARLFEAENRRIRQLDGLQSTLAAINSNLELTALLKEIVAQAINLLDANNGELALYDPELQKLKVIVSQNNKVDNTGQMINLGNGVLGIVAATKKPYKIDLFNENSDLLNSRKTLGSNSGMAVPLMSGNDLLGVLGVANQKNNCFFDDLDTNLLNIFAHQAAIAIRNTRLFEDAKRRADEAETLRKAAAVVTSSLDQTQAINLILEQLAMVIPYDSALVLMHHHNYLKIVGGRGIKKFNQIFGQKLYLQNKNPATDTYLSKKPLVISDIRETYPEFASMVERITDTKSWLGAPLIIQDRTIGILALSSDQSNHFQQSQLRLIEPFADQVAIALENARLYTDMARSADRFETLYHLSQIISTNLRPEDIYPGIHQTVSELMETDYFCISIIDADSETISDVYAVDRGEVQVLTKRPIEKGLFATVLKTRKSLLFHNHEEYASEEIGTVMVGKLTAADIPQSILIVPLNIGSRTIGVLSTQSYQPNMYSKSDLEMLELLATSVAIAIENSRLFNEVQLLAIMDPLTGLYNRRKFDELATSEFTRAKRYRRPLCAIMIDLDQFKQVNDTYGHVVGDQALSSVASLCKDNLRNIDILARFGGEEFVILLPETKIAEARLTAERLRIDCQDTDFVTTSGSISLTISLGLVELDSSCKTLEELITRADQALYASKHAGRNKVSEWSKELILPTPPGIHRS